ncbi:MAG: peptidase M14 [Planctomycetota bacterium]|nr:MAG: peptidase M14 [Planctomycetota bacterium]
MSENSSLEIDCDFPGGNIIVDSISDNVIGLHQDLRDTDGDWFYWCFRLTGSAGKTLKFAFTQSRAIGGSGPAISYDEGVTWAWLGKDVVDENSFSYKFPENNSEVRLSFGMPYLESHWHAFINKIGEHSLLDNKILCTTTKGREAEYVLLGDKKIDPKFRVAVTSRHHCCEMMATYSLEGILNWVLNDSDAQWLRENVHFIFIPFVDKDGVEEGDQGKNRKPRDHGRDYAGESIYSTTKAIRELIPSWSENNLTIGLDLHCPHISGGSNEYIYLVGSADEDNAAQQMQFMEMLEANAKGPLPIHASDFLPFGVAWNVASSYTAGKAFSHWTTEMSSIKLGASIEVPYANAKGVEVNQTSARSFGQDLGRALDQYLQSL